MKRKFISLSLALLLCASLFVPVFAADIQLKNPQTVTISIPEAPGVVFTLENVYEEYVLGNVPLDENGVVIRTHPGYHFYFANNGTISCNQDIKVSFGSSKLINDVPSSSGGYVTLKSGEKIVLNHGDFGKGAPDGEYIFAVSGYVDRTGTKIGGEPWDESSALATFAFVMDDMNPYEDFEVKAISGLSESVSVSPPVLVSALVAKPTASTVLVNGETIAFDAYNINGNNYFKLRDLAYTLNGSVKQFNVGYDNETKAITLTSGEAYASVGGEMTGKGAGNKTPIATTSKIYLDGNEVTFTAYNIDGNNYFKLRDIGQAFDFGVDWDSANNTIVIDTSKGYTPE